MHNNWSSLINQMDLENLGNDWVSSKLKFLKVWIAMRKLTARLWPLRIDKKPFWRDVIDSVF